GYCGITTWCGSNTKTLPTQKALSLKKCSTTRKWPRREAHNDGTTSCWPIVWQLFGIAAYWCAHYRIAGGCRHGRVCGAGQKSDLVCANCVYVGRQLSINGLARIYSGRGINGGGRHIEAAGGY